VVAVGLRGAETRALDVQRFVSLAYSPDIE
jgi:hypothetical protein